MSSNKKQANMEQEFDILSKIQKLDTSPLLLHRIQQKINNDVKDNLSDRWVLAVAASVSLLICINIFVVNNRTKSDHMNLVKSMNLITDNNLYNE